MHFFPPQIEHAFRNSFFRLSSFIQKWLWKDGIFFRDSSKTCSVLIERFGKEFRLTVAGPDNSNQKLSLLRNLANIVNLLLENYISIEVKVEIPCPECVAKKINHFYALSKCEEALLEGIAHFECPFSSASIQIEKLAPEILFKERNTRFLIEDFNSSFEAGRQVLGEGSFGTIYKVKVKPGSNLFNEVQKFRNNPPQLESRVHHLIHQESLQKPPSPLLSIQRPSSPQFQTIPLPRPSTPVQSSQRPATPSVQSLQSPSTPSQTTEQESIEKPTTPSVQSLQRPSTPSQATEQGSIEKLPAQSSQRPSTPSVQDQESIEKLPAQSLQRPSTPSQTMEPIIPSLEVFLTDMVFSDEVGSWETSPGSGIIKLEKIKNVGSALKCKKKQKNFFFGSFFSKYFSFAIINSTSCHSKPM